MLAFEQLSFLFHFLSSPQFNLAITVLSTASQNRSGNAVLIGQKLLLLTLKTDLNNLLRKTNVYIEKYIYILYVVL